MKKSVGKSASMEDCQKSKQVYSFNKDLRVVKFTLTKLPALIKELSNA